MSHAFLFFLSLIAACASEPKVSEAAGTNARYSWIEINAEGRPEVRTIGSSCPSLRIDGKAQPMKARMDESAPFMKARMDESAPFKTARADGAAPRFPVKTCEAPLSEGARAVQVDGEELRAPRPEIRKIVVIGDTGCRVLRKGLSSHVQSCNDPEQWPFLKVARAAAAENPDLVIHVGDYYYRESPCPSEDAGCKNSPSGDNWLSWQADFFEPANALLHAAPWIFVRGNHESCSRGGEGWFRFLDPHPLESCTDVTPSFAVRLGETQFVIVDSSKSDINAAKLRELESLPLKKALLLTHRPVFNPFEPETALKLPSSVQLELAGHVHVFQFMKTTPPQIIAGNAGTALDNPAKLPQAADRITLPGFGYLSLERGEDGVWTALEHDGDGKVRFSSKIP